MSYARRIISIQVSGSVSLNVSGLRTFCRITYANTPTPGLLYCRIQGLTLSQINSLSKCGSTFQLGSQSNTITVQAGDTDSGMTTVFKGNIMYAYPDFQSQPDVAFVIEANGTYDLQLTKTQPTSLQGSVSAEQALTQILQPAGISVQNNGINATLRNPYFPGTVWRQALRLVRAIPGAAGFFNPISRQFTLFPVKGGSSSGGQITVSAQTGMIGYPQFQQNNIVVRTVFAGNIFTTPSQVITVQSQLTSANGQFVAFGVEYDLASETPGGPWETVITASPQNLS